MTFYLNWVISCWKEIVGSCLVNLFLYITTIKTDQRYHNLRDNFKFISHQATCHKCINVWTTIAIELYDDYVHGYCLYLALQVLTQTDRQGDLLVFSNKEYNMVKHLSNILKYSFNQFLIKISHTCRPKAVSLQLWCREGCEVIIFNHF